MLKPEKDKKKDKKDKKKKDKKDQEKDADELNSRSGGHARIPLGEQSGLLSRSNSETDLKRLAFLAIKSICPGFSRNNLLVHVPLLRLTLAGKAGFGEISVSKT